MSKTAIIKCGENYFMKQLSLNKAIVLDQVIFANISGVNGNTDINLSGTMPTASQIVHKTAITQAGLLNDRTVVYSVILDTNVGDFTFNYIGLVNAETNTLCLVMHTDATKKIKTVGQQQGNTITESLWLEMDNASTSTGVTVNAETWQIDYSQRMAGEDERIRLSNFDLYDRLAIHNGMEITKSGNQCAVTSGLAYVAGLRINLEESKTVTVANNQSLYIDAWLSGTTTGEWSVSYNLIAGTNLKDYTNGIFKHYVERIASVDAAGNLTIVKAKSFVTTNDLASTTKIGIVKLSSSVNSTSETEAATPKAIKTAYDLANGAVKKSGDTMTGSLVINTDNYGLTFENSAGCKWLSRIHTDNSYSISNWDSATNSWIFKLRYVGSANKWRFENIEDVTINGLSVLKQGDGGLFSKAPVLTAGTDLLTDDVLSISQTFTLSGNYVNSPIDGRTWSATLEVIRRYHDAGAGATLRINQSNNEYYEVTAYKVNGVWACHGWVKQLTSENISNYLPVGIPQPWPTTNVPSGWLKCNGSSFNKTLYPKLAAAYPSGNLPDLRGEFIRGLDDGRGVDSGRAILSGQGDAIRNIYGEVTGLQTYSSGAFYRVRTVSAYAALTNAQQDGAVYAFNAANTVPTANENRSRNIAFLYIVKAE